MTEVISRALAVYDHLWRAKESGHEIIVRDPTDGSEKDLFLM